MGGSEATKVRTGRPGVAVVAWDVDGQPVGEGRTSSSGDWTAPAGSVWVGLRDEGTAVRVDAPPSPRPNPSPLRLQSLQSPQSPVPASGWTS